MGDIKVLYVNSDGYFQEHSESADSIKVASIKTANAELTDAKLVALVGGNDGSSEHHHDSYYFRESEFMDNAAGAADAGKPVKLNSSGKIDVTMLSAATIEGIVDHDDTQGVANSTAHTAFPLLTGARDLTGVFKYASHPSFANDTELVDKKYVDDQVAGLEWQDSVLSRIDTPPGSPTAGDRYLVIATATGAWAGKENQIAEWNGTAWVFTAPATGMNVVVDDEPQYIYLYSGSAWVAKSYEATTASTGLVKVGNDIRIDSSAAGAGLGFSSGVLSVNVTGALEIASDTLQVKADGIKDTMVDWGTGAGQVSAADMPIADAGALIAATDVEGALAELASNISAQGVSYVAATAIAKGDPLYISGPGEVSKYVSGNHFVVGLALTAASVSDHVKSLANDTLLAGVIVAGVPGDKVYWDSSLNSGAGGYSLTVPTGSGAYVWQLGSCANSTDLHCDVNFVKKNA